MSFLIAAPELVAGAAEDLAGIGSSLADAAAGASGPTTGIAAAAQDEVSTAIASLFGDFGQEFQALNAQARTFHAQFVNALTGSAGAYAGAELAASSTLMQDLGAFGAAVATPYQSLVTTTATNAGTVFGATGQAFNSLATGIATEFGLLVTNPAAFVTNLQTAIQSVTLLGAQSDVVTAVTNHTLGGVTEAFGGLLGDTMVYDAHNQLFAGIQGDGFELPSGPVGALTVGIANFASSPMSGVLLGAVGPVAAPGVALFNEAQTIAADLTGGQPVAALVQVLDTPATVVNAFFNGATLNLDPLAPAVQSIFFTSNEGGTGEVVTGLSLTFGGLFSPGEVVTGPGGTAYYGVGGSALNALGMNLVFYPPDADAGGTIAIPSNGVGPIGATAGFLDIIGQALGGLLLG